MIHIEIIWSYDLHYKMYHTNKMFSICRCRGAGCKENISPRPIQSKMMILVAAIWGAQTIMMVLPFSSFLLLKLEGPFGGLGKIGGNWGATSQVMTQLSHEGHHVAPFLLLCWTWQDCLGDMPFDSWDLNFKIKVLPYTIHMDMWMKQVVMLSCSWREEETKKLEFNLFKSSLKAHTCIHGNYHPSLFKIEQQCS